MAWARMESLQPLQANEVIHVRDEKAAGTQAGSFSSGSFVTRVLNTVKTNTISGASLASNQITLPAGTYWCEGSAPGHACGNHQARLQNTTASTTLITGCTMYAASASPGITNRADIAGIFTLSVQSVIELQHRCSSSKTTDGLGPAANFGTEVYAEAVFWKVA